MKVLWSWLKEYIEGDVEPDKVAERLHYAGIVVDGFEKVSPSFKNVVTGRIVSIKRHPDAEKLALCEVDTGGTIRNIVCGATNIEVGKIVPVAQVGAILQNGKLKVEKRKIRGVESDGMMCSESELELGEDSEGIMLLEENLPLGITLQEALCLEDYLFELEIPSNRPDCYGIFGIAREISALFGIRTTFPRNELNEAEEESAEYATIEIKDPELCPRYSARVIVEAGEGRTPFWMKRRLRASGVRVILPVVDVTNYVMIETGQPLHAFDLDKIPGGTIIVRRAFSGEVIKTLDGIARRLDEGMLLIADREKSIGIAGVMGSASSEVSKTTKNILIEGAHFNQANIMRTSRRLGLVTEASIRFEKNVDPGGTVYAVERAAQLIQSIAGGKVLKSTIDVLSKEIEKREVILRHERLEKVLGADFEKEDVKKILKSLGFDVSDKDNGYKIMVPTFRQDVQKEIDLIEEVARIYGYDKLPSTLPKNNTLGGFGHKGDFVNKIKELALRQGFFEAITLSLIPERTAEQFNLKQELKISRMKRVVNPLSADLALLRSSLLFGLAESMRHNFSDGVKNVRLFEIGKVFYDSGEILPEEELKIGIAVMGDMIEKSWSSPALKNDFFDLKGFFEVLAEEIGVDLVFERSTLPFYFDYCQAKIMSNNVELGYIGELAPEIVRRYNIKQPVFMGEISIDKLYDIAKEERTFKLLPVYPVVTYDASFYVPSEVFYEEIKNGILKSRFKWLKELLIFDLYEGKEIPEGKKSMALRFIFRDEKRTLTEEEARPEFNKILKFLEETFSAEIRRSNVC